MGGGLENSSINLSTTMHTYAMEFYVLFSNLYSITEDDELPKTKQTNNNYNILKVVKYYGWLIKTSLFLFNVLVLLYFNISSF